MRQQLAAASLVATAALLRLFTVAGAAGDPSPVSSCGQLVAQSGILTGDLDCSSASGAAVLIEGGSLDLAGHTITARDEGVRCTGKKCRLYGPGTIRRLAVDPGSNNVGLYSLYSAKVRGVIFENWRMAVFSLDKAEVRSSLVSNGVFGVVAGPVRIYDSIVSGNAADGVRAYESTRDGIHYRFYSLRARRCTFTGNNPDIASYKQPLIRDSSCTTSQHLTIPPSPYSGGDDWNVCP